MTEIKGSFIEISEFHTPDYNDTKNANNHKFHIILSINKQCRICIYNPKNLAHFYLDIYKRV